MAIQKELSACVQTGHTTRAFIRHDVIRRRIDPQRKGSRLRSGWSTPGHAGRGNPHTANNRQSSKRQGNYDEDNGETVMLAPGPGFYMTPGAGQSEVRIAYVLGEAPLRRAVDLLGRALQAYPGRREASRS